MGNATYDFASDLFTLPSRSILNRVDSLDSNTEDGVLYQTLFVQNCIATPMLGDFDWRKH
jgi:hypothetical protein